MPFYTYRREDGSTFDIKQSFSDDPLTTDPNTGQKVVRVIQNAGVIFKGSGFYITDSKGASKSSLNGASKSESSTSESKSSASDTKDPKKKTDTTPKSESA